ncbi:MAG: archease [Actinomycetota bacterium]|nr:archease [Actinomycetota bacterium]
MPYTVLSHTADTGIEATAPTLAGLISELATGMFALVASGGVAEAGLTIEAMVEAGSVEDLVVDVLSDLLYRSEVEDLIPIDIVITLSAPTNALVRAGGVPIADIEVLGPPIKAVTYHDLAVEETPDGWIGRVYFDV